MKDIIFGSKRVNVGAGRTIYSTIESAIALSQKENASISFDFNEVEIIVDQNSNYEEVLKYWSEQLEKRRQERQNSQAYKEFEKELAIDKKNRQHKVDALMSMIDVIDFSDLTQTVFFTNHILKNTSNGDIKYNDLKIKQKLSENGYFSNMCTGEIDENDKEAVGKWLIGQYMACGHPAIADYMDKWTEKFTKNAVKK